MAIGMVRFAILAIAIALVTSDAASAQERATSRDAALKGLARSAQTLQQAVKASIFDIDHGPQPELHRDTRDRLIRLTKPTRALWRLTQSSRPDLHRVGDLLGEI